MKKLINKVLSFLTAFVMVFLSITPTITTAFAAETADTVKTATPDTPESSLVEQTLTAKIYSSDTYRRVLSNESTEITLTGKMPEGAVVKAYPVQYDIADVERSDEPKRADEADKISGEVLLSYDISIFDGKKEFEPDGDAISVTFKSPKLEKFTDDELSVIHVTDEGKEEEITEKSADNDNGELTVETDGFSVFVIVRHENGEIVEPVVIYHYLDYNYTTNDVTVNGESVTQYTAGPYYFSTKSTAVPAVKFCTQIVRNGEKIEHVPTPPDNNADSTHFNGWYVVEPVSPPANENDTVTYTWPTNSVRQQFDKVVTVTMGDVTPQGTPVSWSIDGEEITYSDYADENGAVHVYLAPLYVNYRFVNFYEIDPDLDEEILIARKLLVLDSRNSVTMIVSDMEASKRSNNFHFMGWSTEKFDEATYDTNNKQTDLNTIPLYRDGYKMDTYITLVEREVDNNGVISKEICITDFYYDETGARVDGTVNITIPSEEGKDVNLYAEYERAHWLKFIAGETGWGAMYVPADYLVGKSPATKLKTTTRPGYIFEGWCVGYQDKRGKIIYQTDNVNGQEVPRLVTDRNGKVVNESVDVRDLKDVAKNNNYDNLSQINYNNDTVSTATVSTDPNSSNPGKLSTILDTFLYAYWVPEAAASYKIVVWKQKVTDEVNLPDSKKTYDYYKSETITEYSDNGVVKDISSSDLISDHIANTIAAEYLNHASTGDFKGFHFGRIDDTNIKPDPQGSTVINIYYDRNLMTVNFYASVNYTTTTPTDSKCYYYYDNTTYYPLWKEEAGGTYTYTYSPTYTQTTNNNNNTYYCILDGQYVKLYTTNRTYTLYTGNPYNGTEQYGWYNGSFVSVYYNNGTWYRTRSGLLFYSYSDPYDGNVYSRGSSTNTYSFYYNGTQYTGTRYTQSNTSTTYTGTRYSDTSGTVTTANGDGLYGIDNNGVYRLLTKTYNGSYVWKYKNANGETVTFTGNRYYYFNGSSSTNKVLVWTGLYGQSFEQNGYSWSYVGSYLWNDTNFNQTFLTDFINSNDSTGTVYNLTYDGASGTSYIYHYRQQLDGTYSINNREIARGSGGTFNFTNKFTGFTVSTYSSGENGFSATGGTNQATSSASSSTYPLHVYHTRNTYKFVLNTNYPATAIFADGKYTSESTAKSENQPFDVKYGQVLTNYANIFTPIAPNEYTFEGWYQDASCTKKFIFNEETMADGNKVAYAKWYPKYYKITLEANGGEVAGEGRENESTYFWLQRGQTIGSYNISRNYIVAENVTSPLSDSNATLQSGTYYYYRNVSFQGYEHSRTVYGPNDERTIYIWETRNTGTETNPSDQYREEKDYEGLRPSMYREARYILAEDYHDLTNDKFYKNLVDGFENYGLSHQEAIAKANEWDAQYTDQVNVYKVPDAGDNKWMFVGWNKVTMEEDPITQQMVEVERPYNFSDAVTTEVTLRAEWRLTGAYYIKYTTDMTANELNTHTKVFGSLMDTVDPVMQKTRYDPGEPPDPNQPVVGSTVGYADLADTHGLIAPAESSIHDELPAGYNEYFFEGWRYVDVDGCPLKLVNGRAEKQAWNYNTPYSELIQPSEQFTIRHEFADANGVIHLEAFYKRKQESVRLPDVTELTLDPNKTYGDGYIDPNGVTVSPDFSPGSYNIEANVQGGADIKKLVFHDTQVNNDIHLYDYRNYFVSNNGFFLLGFDPNPDPENLSLGTDYKYIPAYPADSVLGINNENTPNLLYAMWEPMVYATFINTTSGDIILDISDSDDTSVVLVNDATQLYDRTKVENKDHIVVTAGQTIKIVLPKAYDETTGTVENKYLDIKFRNTNPGYLLKADVEDHNPEHSSPVIGTIIGDDNGISSIIHTEPDAIFNYDIETREPTSHKLTYKGAYAHDRRELYVSNAGLKYTFTEEPLDIVTFDVNGGKWSFNYKYPSGINSGASVTTGNNPDSTSNYTANPDDRNPNDNQIDQFQIRREVLYDFTNSQYNTNQIPSGPEEPVPPTGKEYIFMGWTTDEVVAKIHDFSRDATDDEIENSQVIEKREDKDHLKDLVHAYKRRFGLSNTDTVIMYDAVMRMALHDWTSAPGGYTLYAVYAEATTVNYHLMYKDGTDYSNHGWVGAGANEAYTPVGNANSDNTNDIDNKKHLIKSTKVVKGSLITKPKSPLFKNQNNSTTSFLYWLEYDSAAPQQGQPDLTDGASHTSTPVDDPSSLTPFDFSKKITKDVIDLYTSWTDRKSYIVKVHKSVSGTYPGDPDSEFHFRYYIDTVRYRISGGVHVRENLSTEVDSHDPDYVAPLESSLTVKNNEVGDIPLFYWTYGEFLYVQAVRLTEIEYDEHGYTMSVSTQQVAATIDKGKFDGNWYWYDPFYHYNSQSPLQIINTGGNKWEYLGANISPHPCFYNNTWYENSTSNTQISNPNLTVDTFFNNHRDLRIRFLKLAEGGVYRLNDGQFDIKWYGTNNTAVPSSKLDLISRTIVDKWEYAANANSTGRRGRIVAVNSTSNGTAVIYSGDADQNTSCMWYDPDEAEIVFRKPGKYVLTELTPPPGYTIPLVNGNPANTTTVVVNDDGTFTVTGNGLSHGAIPLSVWNKTEASTENEFSVALENIAITRKVKLQIVDSAGNVITNGTRDAKLSLNGYTLQTTTNVDFAMTADRNNSYLTTQYKELEYGEYTITQSQSPNPALYKNADAVTLRITGNGEVVAEGSDFYQIIPPANGTDYYTVQIKNEFIGYNLTMSKTVTGRDNYTDPFTLKVTVDNYSDPNVSPLFANRQFTVYSISGSQLTPTNQTVNFSQTNGTVSISIRHGERLVLRSLPQDIDYIVTEQEASNTTFRASRQSNHNVSIGTAPSSGPGVKFNLDEHILVEVTNDLTVLPAPTAVAQASGTAFAELLMLCILGAGIYYVLSKRRKEVGYNAI